MQQFRFRFFPLFFALVLALSAASCKKTESTSPSPAPDAGNDAGSAPIKGNEAWAKEFKKVLQESEPLFYSAQYLKDKQDAFYLKRVLPDVAKEVNGGKRLSQGVLNRLEDCRQDFLMNRELLSVQLQRVERIFSLVSVLPAYEANDEMGTLIGPSMNLSITSKLAELMIMAQKGLLLKQQNLKQANLSPKVNDTADELARSIAVSTLELIDKVAKTDGPAHTTMRSDIRLLNPAAAADAKLNLDPTQAPFIRDPLLVWEELLPVYDKIFGVIGEIKKQNGAAAIQSKLKEIEGFQATESALLEQLVTATEKQYKKARKLTGLDSED